MKVRMAGVPRERRSFSRAPVAGTAIVLAHRRYVGTYLIEDLSASGVLLVGDAKLSVGERVRVLMQAGARPFALAARVVRHDAAGTQNVFAVEFLAPSPAAQDAIQSLVLHRLQTAAIGRGFAVVIDGPQGMLAGLVPDLLQLGRQAVRVETALTAIACVQATDVPVSAVFVDAGWIDGLTGLTLLEFFSVDYPNVRRIVVCDGPEPAEDSALDDGRVHALLEKPWDRDSLLRALGEQP